MRHLVEVPVESASKAHQVERPFLQLVARAVQPLLKERWQHIGRYMYVQYSHESGKCSSLA